jgi:hypothetical protein
LGKIVMTGDNGKSQSDIQIVSYEFSYLYYVLHKFSWPKIELVKAKSNGNKERGITIKRLTSCMVKATRNNRNYQ